MAQSVRGALLLTNKQLRFMFRHKDGRTMTPDEARESLVNALESGHRFLPLGMPCEGFSYQTGCPGHLEEAD